MCPHNYKELIGLFKTASDFAEDCKQLHDTNKRKHD